MAFAGANQSRVIRLPHRAVGDGKAPGRQIIAEDLQRTAGGQLLAQSPGMVSRGGKQAAVLQQKEGVAGLHHPEELGAQVGALR